MIENQNDNLFPLQILEQDVKSLAQLASNAIIALQIKDHGVFWRSIDQREKYLKEYKDEIFPTATFVSTEALLLYSIRYKEWSKKGLQIQNVDKLINKIIKPDLKIFKSSHDSNNRNGLNPFTLARYIHVLSAIVKTDLASPEQYDSMREKIILVIEMIFENIEKKHNDNWHPFITYHIVRAVQMAGTLFLDSDYLHQKMSDITKKLNEQIREITIRILSQKLLGGIKAGDAIALGFCAAVLVRSDDKSDINLILPALDACFNCQDKSGGWPEGRVIMSSDNLSDNTSGQPLIISTYEIAWIMSDAILLSGRKRLILLRQTEVHQYILRLINTFEYTRASIEHMSNEQLSSFKIKEPKEGWCADHLYNKPSIESWTSASVLSFVTSLYELVQMANQQLIITQFPSIDPFLDAWPDWRCWDKYRQENEPEEKYKVLDYLHRNIVEPILHDPILRPSKENKDVSALLFGPPGTHKTSIVLAIAEGLGWPVITLSPGVFIEKGLEYIEAQANLIFDRLSLLTQTVILFDECDELFRDREPFEGTEQLRAITAFVTAAMLPKLQNLHDNGRVLFFICTNQIESMDKAVIRGGRIDHIVGISPPDEAGRLRILKKLMETGGNYAKIKMRSEDFQSKVNRLLHIVAAKTERFSRFELERVFNLLFLKLENLNSRDISRIVNEQIRNMEKSLSITVEEYKKFEKNKMNLSHPHIEGRRL